jgi:hypothetical protein
MDETSLRARPAAPVNRAGSDAESVQFLTGTSSSAPALGGGPGRRGRLIVQAWRLGVGEALERFEAGQPATTEADSFEANDGAVAQLDTIMNPAEDGRGVDTAPLAARRNTAGRLGEAYEGFVLQVDG